MTKPICPNCKTVDHGAMLPSDHGGQFFFTRCGKCNHGYMYNAKGEVQTGHREQAPSKELLPCPFCGSPARGPHFHEHDRTPGGYWWVECAGLGECCTVEMSDGKEAAVARWNQRHTPEPCAQQVWICSNAQCRAAWGSDPHGHCPACKAEDGSGWSTICTTIRTITHVQLCRPADRAMFASEAGQELFKAAQQHISERAAQPPDADARDAARWRQANADICWSFDGSDRTYYLKAVGRESFEQTVDKRIALTKPTPLADEALDGLILAGRAALTKCEGCS